MTEDAALFAQPEPEPAVRLICTADGDGVRVLSRRRLTKVVLPSERIEEDVADLADRRTGFWIEVRDDQDRVRYRRVLADPLSGEVEVPGDGGSFTLTASPVASRAFALLVPDIPDADHVSLIRGGPPATPAAERAVTLAGRTGEIARLPLREEER